jgi:hypothetical protein
MKKSKVVISVLALGVALVCPSGRLRAQQKPDWQVHIDWAANDRGHPNCLERYLANSILQGCLVGGILTGNTGYGNRYCVMDLAIEAAHRHLDVQALFLTAEIAQCHNSDARKALYQAGPSQVGDYLRGFDRPVWAQAVDVIAASQ